MEIMMDLENILLNLDTLTETFLMELGMLGGILACLLIIVESMLPVLPLFVFITLAFYTFGNWIGFLICWICTCIGCFISFALFRSKIKNWFEKRIAKPGSKTAKHCRFCILRSAEMPKAPPIMPVLVYTMWQNTLSEPASVQTLAFSQLQSGVLVKCLPLCIFSWIFQLRFCYPNLCFGIWYAFC